MGAHAVLANGGVIAPVGTHMVALAAKKHSIPFVVLVGLHKLSPLFPHDPDLAYNGTLETIDDAPATLGCCGVGAGILSHLICSLSAEAFMQRNKQDQPDQQGQDLSSYKPSSFKPTSTVPHI